MPGVAPSPIRITAFKSGKRAALSAPGSAVASSGANACSISRYFDVLNCSAAISALQPTLFNAYSSSASRYAGLIFTRIAPIARRGELRQQPFGAVRRPDADAVARFNAELEQTRREDIDFISEFSPRPTDVLLAENHRRTVGKFRGRTAQEAGNSSVAQRDISRAANVGQAVAWFDLRPGMR